jgi:hypothetical protein
MHGTAEGGPGGTGTRPAEGRQRSGSARGGGDGAVGPVLRAGAWMTTAAALGRQRVRRAIGPDPERGDVPGWVMVTLMTAGLVLTLWAVAGPRLTEVFDDAMDRVIGGP